MSDVFYDVKSDGGGDFLTINAAITQIESDEGTSAFTSNRIIRVFELGTDYTDQATPANTLSPTEINRFIIQGIAGTDPKPRWVNGSSGQNLDIAISNFTLDNIEFESDATQCINIGSGALADGGIIKNCVIHGLDSGSAVIFIRLRGVSGSSSGAKNCQIFNNKFFTTARSDAIRIAGQDNRFFNNQVFDVIGAIDIIKVVGGEQPDRNEVFFNSLLGRSGTLFAGLTIEDILTVDTKIKNNIFSGWGRNFFLHPTATGLELDFNCIFNALTADYDDKTTSTQYTFEDWRTTFPSLSQNSINQDPLYGVTTLGSEELRIQKASPCVDAGIEIELADILAETVGVGADPRAVVITPDGTEVYVTEIFGGKVSVIRTSDNTVIDTVNVSGFPISLDVTPDGSELYVSRFSANAVSVINTSTKVEDFSISVGAAPEGVAVTPDGSEVWIVNTNDASISIISTSSHTVIATITGIGTNPHGIDITPDGNFAYVGQENLGEVYVISTSSRTVVDQVDIGSSANRVVVTPDGSEVYCADAVTDEVVVIETVGNTVTDNISVTDPFSVAVTPDGAFVYVSRGNGTVDKINTSTKTVVDNIAVGALPRELAVTPDGNFVYVPNEGPDGVSIIDRSRIKRDFDGKNRSNPPDMGMSEFTEVFYTVGPGKEFSTVAGALAQILVDEGTSSFTEQRTVDIFNDTYTAGGIPDSSLTPNGAYRLVMQGAEDNFPLFDLPTGLGFDMDSVNFVTIQNLEIDKDFTGAALTFQGSSTDGIVQDCDIHGTASGTNIILIEMIAGCDRTIIKNNLLSMSSAVFGVVALRSKNNRVFNNMLFDIEGGIFILETGATDNLVAFNSCFNGSTTGVGIDLIMPANDNTFKNNICQGFAFGIAIDGGATGFDSDNNCTFGNTNAYFDNDTSTSYVDLAAFHVDFPLLDVNSVETEPGFVNLTLGSEDLHLDTDTTLIADGVAVAGITDDIDGETRPATPSIGADELLAAFYNVATDASKDFLTVAAALAAVLSDEGATAFEIPRIVNIFATGTYAAGGAPDTSLTPTTDNRLIIQGAPGEFPLFDIDGTVDGFRIDTVSFVTIKNLEIDKEAGFVGIVFTNSATDGIIEDCTLHGNVATAATILASFEIGANDNQAFGNTFFFSTFSFGCFNVRSTGNKIFNNQFFDVEGGVFMLVAGATGNEISFNSFLNHDATGVGIDNIVAANDNKFKNNIVSGFAFGIGLHGAATGFESDFNDVFNNTNGFIDNNTSTSYADITALQVDFPGLELSSIEVDPLFVDAVSGSEDLHLQPVSPCSDAGVAITGITDDFDGNPRSDPPEIGMDELLDFAGVGTGIEVGLEVGLERGII